MSSSESGESEEELDSDKSNLDENYKEGTQKYISPKEVMHHIEKLWKKEGNLLNLLYGKFEPKAEGLPFETTSLGIQLFFID